MEKLFEDIVYYDFSEFKGANAHEIIGEFRKHARAQEWGTESLNKVVDEAMSGDYKHLWDIICKHSETPDTSK